MKTTCRSEHLNPKAYQTTLAQCNDLWMNLKIKYFLSLSCNAMTSQPSPTSMQWLHSPAYTASLSMFNLGWNMTRNTIYVTNTNTIESFKLIKWSRNNKNWKKRMIKQVYKKRRIIIILLITEHCDFFGFKLFNSNGFRYNSLTTMVGH